jgi:hypothetical protein
MPLDSFICPLGAQCVLKPHIGKIPIEQDIELQNSEPRINILCPLAFVLYPANNDQYHLFSEPEPRTKNL